MTLSEIVPNSSRSSGSRNAMMSAEIASEMTVTTRYSCFAASQARLLSRAPSSCATTTAPPVASAAKILMNEHVYHIDERNARHRRLAARGDHDGVGKTDRDGEHLLEHKRPDQFFKCRIREQLLFRSKYAFFLIESHGMPRRAAQTSTRRSPDWSRAAP